MPKSNSLKPKLVQQGFSLVEVLVSLAILALILFFSNDIFFPTQTQSRKQLLQLSHHIQLKKQIEYFRNLGFWIHDFDSNAAPTSQKHPGNMWYQQLRDRSPKVTRATLTTTFLTFNQNQELVYFSPDTAEFNNNSARNKVKLDITLYYNASPPVSASLYLVSTPTIHQANAQLYILKKALEQYKETLGTYPERLNSLVTQGILVEIPNDPLTSLNTLNNPPTRIEEIEDWAYTKTSSKILLNSKKQPELIKVNFDTTEM